MHGYIGLDGARDRQAAFRAEAAAGRLAAHKRAVRFSARRRVANLIVAIGYLVVGAGRRLDREGIAPERHRLRAVS